MASGLITSYDDTTRTIEARWKYIKALDPNVTVVLTDCDIVPVENTVVSWDQENIPLTNSINAGIEGADYIYSDIPNAKLTNYVQKIQRGEKVSYMNRAADHPAIANRVQKTALNLMKWCKQDLEYTILNGTAAQGSNAVAATAGGLQSFVPGAYTTAATVGTVLDLPTTIGILQKNWNDGGQLDRLLVNATQKMQRLDQFTTTINNYQRNIDAMAKKAVFVTDSIVTTFGEVEIMPHRYLANGAIIGYMKDFVKIGEYKTFFRDTEVARTGDFEPVVIVGYYTVYVGNVRAVAKASGFTG